MKKMNITDEKKRNDGSVPQLLIKRGQTTYIVGVHFKNDGGETIEDKVKRLLRDAVIRDYA